MEIKSETKDLWLLRHPQWVKWLRFIVQPFLVVACCVIFLPFIENNYELTHIVSSLLLGVFPIYMCFHAFKVYTFIGTDVEFNTEGFCIYWPNVDKKKYLWSEVSKLNHYASVQVLELRDTSNIRILAVTEQATNYTQFVDLAVQKTGLKY